METKQLNPRWWDPLSAVFLIIILLTAATRLYATEWTGYLERVQYLGLLGGLAGLAFGKSRFSPRLVKWMGIGYTLFVIPWQLGFTLSGELSWPERMGILITRIGLVVGELIAKKAVHDPLLFLALMALLFWLLGITSGYYLVRYGQPWPAIIPAGIALIIISHYDPGLSSWARYLGFYIFFSLLIVGRLTYMRYRMEWDAQGVMAAPGTGMDIGRAVSLVVVVLVLFAWTAPVIGSSLSPVSELWVKMTRPWNDLRSRFSDAFSSLQSNVGVVTDFYGNNLVLGTGTHLGNDVVFTVQTTSNPPKGTQYYWRARTYDFYNGDWSSTISSQKAFSLPGIAITYPKWSDRVVADFVINSRVTLLNTIYTPSQPLSVNHPGTADLVNLPDGTQDVSVLYATPPLKAGESYQARGWISNPSAAQLRVSGTDYPDWVMQRYLQLPDNLPEDFGQLARRVTLGLDNPYDKVDAITGYLRRTISYKQSIPNPPPGRDALEWFLFDLKQGYCNYYASAEVVLLRSLGIPARMSVGFAEGETTSTGGSTSVAGTEPQVVNTYTVRYRDSHAWPEVYFNHVGWVEFEPTVSQPARVLPPGNNDPLEPAFNQDPSLVGAARGRGLNGVDDPAKDPVRSAVSSIAQNPVASAAVIGVTGLAALAAAGLWWRVRHPGFELETLPVLAEKNLRRRGITVPAWLHRWARRSLFSPLERAYGVINTSLRLLGRSPKSSETPSERAANLGMLLPVAAESVRVVLDEYQQAQYSQYPGDFNRAREASRAVRWMAWRAYLNKIFDRFNLRGRV
ncbi:MAG: transglutaminase domain-containing protein [Anaerolineaceae bacterium]|nr:transglutaminase domain-containing protein [Anaerolineaceae bacterium]